MVQQALAGGRQVDAARVAVEQGGAERALQVGQALADGRGGDELALGRLADAARFAHGHEQLKADQVDAAGKAAFGEFHGGRLGRLGSRCVFRIFPLNLLKGIANGDGLVGNLGWLKGLCLRNAPCLARWALVIGLSLMPSSCGLSC